MDGLRAATARIAEELNSQYVMAYASPHATDGKYHSIRVRVTRPGYKVRARNGYVGVAKPTERVSRHHDHVASDARWSRVRIVFLASSTRIIADWIAWLSSQRRRELALAHRVARRPRVGLCQCRGMRVLGPAAAAHRRRRPIFLHREFGVQVWATDLWCRASQNLQRDPRCRRRRRRRPDPCRCPVAAVCRRVLRRHRVHRFVLLLRHR